MTTGEVLGGRAGFRRYTPFVMFVALLLLHATLAWLTRQPAVLTEGDDAVYLLLARALGEGSYHDLFRIDHPPHRLYPPGYPALLFLWSLAGGERSDWIVLLNVSCSVAALGLITSAVRSVWNSGGALAILTALAINPWLVNRAGSIASEAPFLFFQSLALWACTRVPDRRRWMALAGGAAVAAALTRSIGATLIVAIGLLWLWHRQYRWLAMYAVAALLTVGVWLGWTALAPEQAPGESYIADAAAGAADRGIWTTLLARLTNKLPYPLLVYRGLPGPNLPGTLVDDVAGLVIAAPLLVAGAVWTLRRWPAAFIYLCVYGSLLWLWPWPVERFLIPVMPLVVTMLVAGTAAVAQQVGSGAPRIAVLACAGVLSVNGAWLVASEIEARDGCVQRSPLGSSECLEPDQASFFAAVRYLRQHVPGDATVLSGKPATIHFYTGHRLISQTLALSQSPEDFVPFLREQGVTHVLLLAVMPFSDAIPSYDRLPLGPMLRENCTQLLLEASFPPASYLFRVPREVEPVAEGTAHMAACAAIDTYLKAERPNSEEATRP